MTQPFQIKWLSGLGNYGWGAVIRCGSFQVARGGTSL